MKDNTFLYLSLATAGPNMLSSTGFGGIERDIGSLQLEEKKLVAEIKRTAKTGNEAATKILACQLIRLRHQISNLQGSRAHIGGIAIHIQVKCCGCALLLLEICMGLCLALRK
ncbi:hypothetical protein ABZP36_016674 [Zizania latifolia]